MTNQTNQTNQTNHANQNTTRRSATPTQQLHTPTNQPSPPSLDLFPPSPETQQPLNLTNKHIHFVGIGGCGMSGLARISKAAGAIPTGSDQSESDTTQKLAAEGIPVSLDHPDTPLPQNCELLIASAAVPPDHPQLTEAKRRNIPILKYAQLLGQLMIGRTGIAIAGTHGKSTTTSMLAHTLLASDKNPTFIVGATCKQLGGGARAGRPDMLIAEACEYDRSFHAFHPTHSVILNIEEDHLDIYKSLDDIIESFRTFAAKTPPTGSLLIGHESAHRTKVTAGLDPAGIETLGFSPQADWHIQTAPAPDQQHNNSTTPPAAQQVTISHNNQPLCTFTLTMPGEHNAYNAAAAAVTAHRLGTDWPDIANALSNFLGLDRRMQTVGSPQNITVIDDYGHHPTEVEATLRALRHRYHPEKNAGRLICVFQPHQHSRTRFLLDQFATSFSQADAVIVPHIYFVRDSEADRRAVSAADLVQRLQQRGVLAVHINDFDEITNFLLKHCKPNDLLVVMGAGPVWKIARSFVQQKAQQPNN